MTYSKEPALHKFYNYLDKPGHLRYCFFILWMLSVILNSIFFQNNSNIFILYVIAVIFLGAGFYNKSPLFLMFFTTLIVLCRFLLVQNPNMLTGSFFILLLTYSIITFISAGLMKNIQKVKNDTLELTTALVNALDSRDPHTLHHSENVAKYAFEIAKEMNLKEDICNNIRIGGLLHDIGKIGIPEPILTKPGRLTTEEYDFIKAHPTIGYKMIKHVANFSSRGILDIILYHHERYDGKGYPKGLKGQQIPLLARIVAVADTFDAMTSKRVYRQQLDYKCALEEIRKNKGTQFDPVVADAFLNLYEEKSLNSTNENYLIENT